MQKFFNIQWKAETHKKWHNRSCLLDLDLALAELLVYREANPNVAWRIMYFAKRSALKPAIIT